MDKILIFQLIIIFILLVILLWLGKKAYQIKRTNHNLLKEQSQIEKDLSWQKKKFEEKQQELSDNLSEYYKIKKSSQEESLKDAKLNYFNVLEKEYELKELEYDNSIKELFVKLDNIKAENLKKIKEEQDRCEEQKKEIVDKIQEEIAAEQLTLERYRQTRAAAISAYLQEKKIQEDASFYTLAIKEDDLRDIAILETVKPKLKEPRVLSMLIWTTFYRKAMTTLSNNVLGVKTITGIYKITNLKTGQCYIGQAVDVAKRWAEHAKAGLGIDTPVRNKLYQAMKEYGLTSFSWELIEQTSKEELNDKERYYIELYQAKEYGYNSLAGNK